jgi:hypothetical protein
MAVSLPPPTALGILLSALWIGSLLPRSLPWRNLVLLLAAFMAALAGCVGIDHACCSATSTPEY